jgi:hypothetical protein
VAKGVDVADAVSVEGDADEVAYLLFEVAGQ